MISKVVPIQEIEDPVTVEVVLENKARPEKKVNRKLIILRIVRNSLSI